MGRVFEDLFMRVAKNDPALELKDIQRWSEWDQREALTGLGGNDIGIDLVAQHASGMWIAIQCKCYQETTRLDFNRDMSRFLALSSQEPFQLRWFVATCPWGKNAEAAIKGRLTPPVRRIDFINRYADIPLDQPASAVREPWAKQADAIEHCVTGLENYDRGKLVMACGTGKTFTALRIAEAAVPENGSILFLAPSIALVSQAREEWLRLASRPMGSVVVCSDATAGKSAAEDISLTEILSPVTTDPEKIANTLKQAQGTRVAYCTYHSIGRITEAQQQFGLDEFDLIIADEAHRTTGIVKNKNVGDVNFQAVHDNERVRGKKRLYMTATPRIYSETSKSSRRKEGCEVTDMGEKHIYGPEFCRLSFRAAAEEGMLSDYRVIVLGVNETAVTASLKKRLESIDAGKSKDRKTAPGIQEMTRLLGVSLALNGLAEGSDEDRPGVLRRSIAYANTISRSKWYAKALVEPQILSATTRRLEDRRAQKIIAEHHDAGSSALARNTELRKLNQAGRANTEEARVISNVKLFTEGVNVPALDAIVFLDPKQSQVDIVQAVGRVMRKSEGKRFGYIIVPVVIPPDKDILGALEKGQEGYKTVGKVLRALQSHDEKLLKNIDLFVQMYEQGSEKKPPTDDSSPQASLNLEPVEGQGIYAHIAKASGLSKPGQQTADDIKSAVEYAGSLLHKDSAAGAIAAALGMPGKEGEGLNICKIGSLLLANACLLQKRLRGEDSMKMILSLESVSIAKAPREMLRAAWIGIMGRDYVPVFDPAVAVLDALSDSKPVNEAIQHITECANRVADSLSEIGYDHAGPLYHQILGSAQSDGAFYTENSSALMLARLALNEDFADWSDIEAIKALRIIDPACGTGTLLMAALKTVKERVVDTMAAGADAVAMQRDLHEHMVEHSLCGLDINRHAVQLAACNLTLGAPSVDYQHMNLHTLAYGPDKNDEVRLGSLEILASSDTDTGFRSMALPTRSLNALDARQVNQSKQFDFPLQDLDVVIMNPPFTDNVKRDRKFDSEAKRKMQDRELWVKKEVEEADQQAINVINSNSIESFFTPLAERLISQKNGTLATVIPTTACLGAAAKYKRTFLAKKFQVELVVTSHDPKHPNFSGNTAITESFMICRRVKEGAGKKNTRFVSLHKNPDNAQEAIQLADAIASGDLIEWGKEMTWPADRVKQGDWRPAALYNPELVEVLVSLESRGLVKLGDIAEVEPAGRRIRDAFNRHADEGSNTKPILWDHKTELRKTMAAEPDIIASPKGGKRDYAIDTLWPKAGRLLIAGKINTNAIRTTSVLLDEPALGSAFVPVRPKTKDESTVRSLEKALCVWFTSTPFIICLLGARSRKLTYPNYSLDSLRSLPVPNSNDMLQLAEIYDNNKDKSLKPWLEMASCEVRKVIDDAVAPLVGVDSNTMDKWRRLITEEPTVSNKRIIRTPENED